MNKGRSWTAKNPTHSDEVWALAQRMNTERPGHGEWVPKEAIAVPDWQVRGLNAEKVREYSDVSENLPPLSVQRGSFYLVDGRHRYRAEPSDCVRIVELDIADDDLFIESVKANIGHGLPYTRPERQRLTREIIKRYPTWSDSRVAEVAGCSRHTVTNHRPQVVQLGQPEPFREGKDGKSYPVRDRAPSPTPRVPAHSYDPGPEREADGAPDPWERFKKPDDPGPEAYQADQEPPTDPYVDPRTSNEPDAFEGDDHTRTMDPETGETVAIGATTQMDPDDDDEPEAEDEQRWDQFTYLHDGFQLRASWRVYGPPASPLLQTAAADGLAGLQRWLDGVAGQLT